MTEVVEERIGRRGGSQKERWMKKRTWKIIDKRKVQNINCNRQKHCLRKKKLRMNIHV